MSVDEVKAWVNEFTIRLGPASVRGKLVPVRRSKSAEERSASDFRLVTPDGQPVEQRYISPDGTLYRYAELSRGRDTEDGIQVLSAEEVAAARESQLPKNIMEITVHDAKDVDTKLFPGQDNAYVFIPGRKDTKGWKRDDTANEKWAEFLIAAAQDTSKSLIALVNVRGNDGLYRLTVWRGQLLIQKQMFPGDLNDHPVEKPTLPTALRNKTGEVLDKLKVPFDPSSYRDLRLERFAALAGTEAERAAVTAPNREVDIMAALDAFDM